MTLSSQQSALRSPRATDGETTGPSFELKRFFSPEHALFVVLSFSLLPKVRAAKSICTTSGAGSSDVNGLYKLAPKLVDGRPYYHHESRDVGIYNESGRWCISTSNGTRDVDKSPKRNYYCANVSQAVSREHEPYDIDWRDTGSVEHKGKRPLPTFATASSSGGWAVPLVFALLTIPGLLVLVFFKCRSRCKSNGSSACVSRPGRTSSTVLYILQPGNPAV